MRLKQFISGLLFVALLTGCTVLDPYTGEAKTSKATTYGLGGALLCGLIGAGESSKHARNAAAGCALIGMSIGAYMDYQEKALRERLLATGVQVKREGNRIRLIMPSNITFATDRSDLSPKFEPVLDSIAEVLNHYQDTRLRIVGHTDSTGDAAYNLALSERRAQAVAQYLRAKGIAPQRLQVFGAGENQPIASNQTEAGRALNRRVELTIIPMPKQ